MSSAYKGGGGLNIEDLLERLIWQIDLANKQGEVNYSQQLFPTNFRWILTGFVSKRHIFESSRQKLTSQRALQYSVICQIQRNLTKLC